MGRVGSFFWGGRQGETYFVECVVSTWDGAFLPRVVDVVFVVFCPSVDPRTLTIRVTTLVISATFAMRSMARHSIRVCKAQWSSYVNT